MNLSKWFSNPAVKGAAVGLATQLAQSVDATIQAGPQGGFATWLNAHSWSLPFYFAVAAAVHTYASNITYTKNAPGANAKTP